MVFCLFAHPMDWGTIKTLDYAELKMLYEWNRELQKPYEKIVREMESDAGQKRR